MSKSKSSIKSSPKSPDQQLKDLKEKYARAIADYQNLEKRIQSQQGQFVRFATADLIGKFITILDDLERAANHLSDDGLNMVITQFNKTLQQEGVTALDPQSQPFDPALMECLDQVAGKKDQVITVLQKGYQLGDTLIRPAQVTVGSGKTNKESE